MQLQLSEVSYIALQSRVSIFDFVYGFTVVVVVVVVAVAVVVVVFVVVVVVVVVFRFFVQQVLFGTTNDSR